MIVLTAFAIGLLATGLRSVVCYALAGCLIVAAFAAATMISMGPISLTPLVLAILGYNAGITSAVGGYLAVDRMRTA